MTKTERQQLLSQRVSWLIWAGLAVLVILLGSAFSRAWQTNQILRGELSSLQPMVTTALREQSALREKLIYVQSDEYVAAWSKTRAKMTLPGETLVVSIPGTPTPMPETVAPVAPVPSPTKEPFWTAWLQRLRDR